MQGQSTVIMEGGEVAWMRRRWVTIAAAASVLILVTLAALVAWRWPFTRERITSRVERASGSRARFEGFRINYLPRPGCTIEGLVLEREAGNPIAQVGKVIVRSSWFNLLTFRKRVASIEAEGLRVRIVRPLPPPVGGRASGIGALTVGEFTANEAQLEIAGRDKGVEHFNIPQLRLHEVGKQKRIIYSVLIDLPHPPGRLRSSGSVGPFGDDAAKAPLSGSFELRDAALDKYRGLSGKIRGDGMFHGVLENIQITGNALASQFEVNRSGHPVDLRAVYRAAVNGTSGDVLLEAVQAQFLRTELAAEGSIHGSGGKVVSAHFTGDEARIEDLLWMFTRASTPALRGDIRLRASADLQPGNARFLQRLLLRGNFDIANAQWRPRTQTKVNGWSARARDAKKEDREPGRAAPVLSRLRGDVSLKSGLASLSRVTLQLPGAIASGGGTFNLLTKAVDLKGVVTMKADASEAASGFKAILLKPFDRLFRRGRKEGATLPVSVSGRYPRPKYKVSLMR